MCQEVSNFKVLQATGNSISSAFPDFADCGVQVVVSG